MRFGPQFTLSNSDQQAVWTGLAAAAATAAVIGTGGTAAFAAAPLLSAGLIGGAALGAGGASKAQSNQQQKIQDTAIDNANKVRRDAIIKAYGAQQQADSTALAATRSRASSSNPSPGGFIGQGMNTAGTF